MTSKLTREQLHERARENVKALKMASRQTAFQSAREEILADLQLAELALAAMDGEPHTDDELSNLLWYSQEATCHSDPNYYCEFQRLATPGLIAGIIRELQERRKAAMDSKPVILYRQINPVNGMKTYWAELDPEEFRHLKQHTDENAEFMTLYRHAQPAPVVPKSISVREAISALESEDAVTTIGQAYKMGWNACRAAMLQASPVCTCPGGDGSLRWPCPVHPGNSPANPGCWCRTCRPVVLNDMRFVVCPDCGNKRCPRANDHRNSCTGSNEPGQEGSAYPDTPREAK